MCAGAQGDLRAGNLRWHTFPAVEIKQTEALEDKLT